MSLKNILFEITHGFICAKNCGEVSDVHCKSFYITKYFKYIIQEQMKQRATILGNYRQMVKEDAFEAKYSGKVKRRRRYNKRNFFLYFTVNTILKAILS